MNVNFLPAPIPYTMSSIPTPAGHQADLNNIMGMVEGLSHQLEENREATARIVEKMGLIRSRAMEDVLTKDELLRIVSMDENGQFLDFASHGEL